MKALELYNAMTAIGVSVPRMKAHDAGVMLLKAFNDYRQIRSIDAIYIMCGVLRDKLTEQSKLTEWSVFCYNCGNGALWAYKAFPKLGAPLHLGGSHALDFHSEAEALLACIKAVKACK